MWNSELTEEERNIIWYLEHESILDYNLKKATKEGYFDEVPIHRAKLKDFRSRKGNPKIHQYIVPIDIRLFTWETADGIENKDDSILEKSTRKAILDNIFEEEPKVDDRPILVKTKTGLMYPED